MFRGITRDSVEGRTHGSNRQQDGLRGNLRNGVICPWRSIPAQLHETFYSFMARFRCSQRIHDGLFEFRGAHPCIASPPGAPNPGQPQWGKC